MIRRASKRPLAGFAAIVALAYLSACNPIVDNLGNRTLKENVEQIQIGRSNKNDVVRLLGSPSNIAAFDENTWYYISARQVQLAFLRPRTTDQHVLLIRFDSRGIVREMKELGMQDVQATTYVGRVTPTRGGEPGLLRSLYDTIMRGPGPGTKRRTGRGPGPE